ncbi:hypothetical protein M2302_002914 [Micromonospora sp. A200]|uniref:hypothetical protein n=1 Tax=Micromonospora sp. A200 TaxID=2940568 RepID=UPI0024737DE0|nr:hypothetical protein [Micromonospora sp. A200]MDH6462734.1 hypothetical protein [Micromonospora sp. A200]
MTIADGAGDVADLHLSGGHDAIVNWPDAVRAAEALGESTRLVVTMQLGYSLLVPLLVEQATGRAAYPLVHDRNPAVLDLYRDRLRGRPLLLTTLSAGDIRRWLDSDAIIVANVDTSYPGTRQVRTLPFLGGRLAVPFGLLSMATRRRIEVRAVAAPGNGGHLVVGASSPLPDDPDGALRAIGSQFERWIGAHPEQWMAWGKLVSARDGPSAATPATRAAALLADGWFGQRAAPAPVGAGAAVQAAGFTGTDVATSVGRVG